MPNDRFKDVDYQNLQDGESEESLPIVMRTNATLRSKAKPFIAGLVTMLILVLIPSIATLAMLSPQPAKSAAEIEQEEWNYCGRSSRVAMEKGCVMEPLFYGWMPRQCVFQELTDQFPVFEDREWFADKNMTIPLSPESLWKGEHIMIYTRKYHGEHCLFQWRKLQYAYTMGERFLDNKTISVHHTTHCADQITKGCEGDYDVNEVELGFYRCRKTIW